MTDATKTRTRRSAEQLAQDHFDAAITKMTLSEKVDLVKRLKGEIENEVADKKSAAESANLLTQGL